MGFIQMSPNGMYTYNWPLHVPTKLQVHSIYISSDLGDHGMGRSKFKFKKM